MSNRPLEPRFRGGDTANLLSLEKLAALIPAAVWAILLFDSDALSRILLSTLTVFLLDVTGCNLQRTFLKVPMPVLRLRGAVIGLLLALLSPADLPIWLLTVADLLAVALCQIFRSEAHYPLSLTATVGCFLLLFAEARRFPLLLDSEEGLTLLEMLRAGDMPSLGITDMLLGRMDGNMGELPSLLLLLGGGYLLFCRQIGWQIPLAGGVAAAVTAYVVAPDTMSVYYFVGAHLLSGSFLLVLLFIVADRSSAPITGRAGLVCGGLYGLLTVYLRHKFSLDGALPAALFCSLIARPLDHLMAPLPFGGRRK